MGEDSSLVHFPWSRKVPLCAVMRRGDILSRDELVVTCPACKKALHEWRYHSIGSAVANSGKLSNILFEVCA